MKLLYFILLIGLFFSNGVLHAQLPGYSYYKTITIQATEVSGSATLSNFPMLFSETDPNLAGTGFGGNVQSINGYDIAFTLDDGSTVLDHQIEKYDPTTGEYVAWIRIPSLDAVTNSTLHVYYGNPSVSTDPSTESVWDINHVSVYHLTDDFSDKTQNNNDLTNFGTSNNGAGAAAKCREFNQGDYLHANTDASYLLTGDVTVSAWVDLNVLQVGSYENMILDVGGIDESNIENKLYNFNILSTGQLGVFWENGLGLNTDLVSLNSITFPPSGYTMLSFTRNTTLNEVRFYQDGIQLDLLPSTYLLDPDGGGGAELSIGINQQFPTLDYDGKMDEIRISNNVRSEDWLRTNFNSISSPNTFYILGSQTPLCNAGISYPSSELCADDGTIAATILFDTGGTFSASPATITLNAVNGEITLSNATADNYDIIYTAPLGCKDTFNLTVNAEDDPSFSYAETVFCNNELAEDTLSTAMSGGTFSASSTDLLVDGSSGQVDIQNSLPGTYQIYYLTAGIACPNTDSVEITINAEDDPSFSYPAVAWCESAADADPDFVATPGGTWSSSPTGLDLDTGDGQVEIDDSNIGTYTIYYTTSGVCPNVDSLENFEVTQLDDATFDYTTPICTPGNNPLPNNVINPGGTFTEGSGNVVFTDLNTGEINLSNSNAGNWTIEYTTNGTCPNSFTFDIEILNPIDPSFWMPDTICLNGGSLNLEDSVNLQLNESNQFYSYGTNGGASLGGSNSNMFQPNASGIGSYFVTQVVSSSLGCVDSSTLQVDILPNFNANFSDPDTLCQAFNSYNLNDFFNGSTDEGGVWIGIGVTNDSIWNSGSLSEGNYDLTYTVGIGQCADTVTRTVYLKADVDSSWTSPPDLCSDSPVLNLNNLITGTLNGSWSGTGVSGNVFDPSLAQTGTHLITYSVDGYACSESYTQPIVIYEAPIIDAGTDEELCDTTYQLNASSNLPSQGYWLNDPSTIFISDSTEESANIAVLNPGNYTYYYYVDQSGVCAAIDSVNIQFDAMPIADAGEDQQLDFEFETYLDAAIPEAGTGEWSLIEGGGEIWSVSDPNTFVNQLSAGTNQFMWTVSNGSCPEQSDILIVTVNDLWIPTVVTPNSDGKNDFFEIKGIESKSNKIEIYNRWGQLRFVEENYQNTWDGSDNSGKRLEDGTYYYIITIEEDRIINGYVVLKR